MALKDKRTKEQIIADTKAALASIQQTVDELNHELAKSSIHRGELLDQVERQSEELLQANEQIENLRLTLSSREKGLSAISNDVIKERLHHAEMKRFARKMIEGATRGFAKGSGDGVL